MDDPIKVFSDQIARDGALARYGFAILSVVVAAVSRAELFTEGEVKHLHDLLDQTDKSIPQTETEGRSVVQSLRRILELSE